MSEHQYRLVNMTTGWADPSLVYSRQQAVDIADVRNRDETNHWAVQVREVSSQETGQPGPFVLLPEYQIDEPSAQTAGAAITARALTALRETAQAFKAAGRDREFVDASLTVTCHADYVGLINGVLDEVFPPEAVYDLCLVDKVDRLDVMAAVKVIAADWRAGARKVRPTCGEDPCYGHDGDSEVDEAVADVYDEVATTLLRAFGLPTEEA